MNITLPTRASKVYDPQYAFNRGIVAQTGYVPEGQMFLQDVWPLKIIDTKKAITEGVGGREVPILRVKGLFQLGDRTNANGRVYRTPILHEAVTAIQEDLQSRQVWGEFDHPPDAKIHLDRISHLITNIYMEGSSVIGEAEIIEDLPYGKQLATLLRHGSIGISSRGIGDMEVREEGGQEVYYVTEGYRFVTWDAVAEPSVHGARLQIVEGKLQPIMNFKKAAKPKSRTRPFQDHSRKIAENRLVDAVGEYLRS